MNVMKAKWMACVVILAAGLSMSAEAAKVTIKTNEGTASRDGKVIVRHGGQGRIPITIVDSDKLYQFYLHENRVQKIESDSGKATIVAMDTAVYPDKSEMLQKMDELLKGMEVTLEELPADGWVKIRFYKDKVGFIREDRLTTVVTFGEEGAISPEMPSPNPVGASTQPVTSSTGDASAAVPATEAATAVVPIAEASPAVPEIPAATQ